MVVSWYRKWDVTGNRNCLVARCGMPWMVFIFSNYYERCGMKCCICPACTS